ncbi:uncharacterized protein N7515_000917 [Penicillium bovifimosum]|uniref:Uncharacterized protein n=1 Tax=Penicillium bovifimosum TaxID=126998 RepID=A0A9W9HGQ5_9EURO|nr:uncharacterized protein N7515_000917 [Penicillium bovifimosum]KAJ5146353.1 hypothetical protein N7515_000917 [Penicillium bovifimosum]
MSGANSRDHQALFAYWLRSSVVSVLFSLISESFRLGNTLIIPIFGPRDLASALAHASLHCVIGLTLPPIDATFSSTVRLVRALGEEAFFTSRTTLPFASKALYLYWKRVLLMS